MERLVPAPATGRHDRARRRQPMIVVMPDGSRLLGELGRGWRGRLRRLRVVAEIDSRYRTGRLRQAGDWLSMGGLGLCRSRCATGRLWRGRRHSHPFDSLTPPSWFLSPSSFIAHNLAGLPVVAANGLLAGRRRRQWRPNIEVRDALLGGHLNRRSAIQGTLTNYWIEHVPDYCASQRITRLVECFSAFERLSWQQAMTMRTLGSYDPLQQHALTLRATRICRTFAQTRRSDYRTRLTLRRCTRPTGTCGLGLEEERGYSLRGKRRPPETPSISLEGAARVAYDLTRGARARRTQGRPRQVGVACPVGNQTTQ
jgi:hypothetical protein